MPRPSQPRRLRAGIPPCAGALRVPSRHRRPGRPSQASHRSGADPAAAGAELRPPALLRAAARLRPARKLRRAYAQLSPLPRCGSTARRRFSCHGSRTGRQAPAPQGSCKARRSRSRAEFAEPWDSDSCGWESAARIRCSRKMHGKEPALPARDSFHRIKTGASRRFSKTARAFLKEEHTAH